MVFSSLEFIFRFLPIFFLAYFATPARYRNIVLVVGSLVFYAVGEPVYISYDGVNSFKLCVGDRNIQ